MSNFRAANRPEGWQAYETIEARVDSAPLLFTCEHASNDWPRFHPAASCVDKCWLNDHYGWDPGAAELSRGLAQRFGSASVLATFSRLFIDANRGTEQPDLIRNFIGETCLNFNYTACKVEFAERLKIHAEFHQEVERQSQLCRDRFEQFLLLSIHSFTRVLGDDNRDHLQIGLLHDRANDLFAKQYAEAIQNQGMSCVLNEPYSGYDGLVYSAARHGGPHKAPYLVIEVRSDLIEDPQSSSYQRVLKTLGDALEVILAEMSLVSSDT